MWTEGLSRHCANSLPELSSSQHPRDDKLNKRQHRGAAPTLFPSCSLHPAQQKRQRSCLSGGAGGKQPARQGHINRRHGFHPWVGTMFWRRAWLPTPIVFLPGESRGQGNLAATVQGVTESGPTERCLPVDSGAHPGTGSPRLLTLGRSGHQPPRPPPLPPPRCLQVDSCISSPGSLVLALPSAPGQPETFSADPRDARDVPGWKRRGGPSRRKTGRSDTGGPRARWPCPGSLWSVQTFSPCH